MANSVSRLRLAFNTAITYMSKFERRFSLLTELSFVHKF